jgi:hypothetical protein
MKKHIHHIVPRCLGGTDDPSNLIELTYEEHVEAHRILAEQYPEHGGLRHAYLLMAGQTEEARLEATQRWADAGAKVLENLNQDFEHQSEAGKIGGMRGGASTSIKWRSGEVEHPGYLQPRHVRVSNGKKCASKKTFQDLSSAGKAGSARTNSQKWKCSSCNMITTAPSMASHFKSSGHSERVRLD